MAMGTFDAALRVEFESEFEDVFKNKRNTKVRETAWENIAARVSACNPTGQRRTSQQLKMEYEKQRHMDDFIDGQDGDGVALTTNTTLAGRNV